MTLEQQRAQDVWQKSAGYKKEHVNAAKSMPALIMNSGLMQVLVYAEDKGKERSEVARHLRQWLHQRFQPQIRGHDFNSVMNALMAANPQQYQAITQEALSWLRWMRQIAAARYAEQGGK